MNDSLGQIVKASWPSLGKSGAERPAHYKEVSMRLVKLNFVCI